MACEAPEDTHHALQLNSEEILETLVKNGTNLNLDEFGLLPRSSGTPVIRRKRLHDVVVVDPDLIEVAGVFEVCLAHEDREVPSRFGDVQEVAVIEGDGRWINRILRKVEFGDVTDGGFVAARDRSTNNGGVRIGNAPEVSLEYRVEDPEANASEVTRPIPLLEALQELFPDLIEYSTRVALTAEGLVAIVVVAMKVFSKQLCDELDVDDWNSEFLPVHLVFVLVSHLHQCSNLELAQYANVLVQEVLSLEVVERKLVLATASHQVRE